MVLAPGATAWIPPFVSDAFQPLPMAVALSYSLGVLPRHAFMKYGFSKG
jgi:hypothetical protein